MPKDVRMIWTGCPNSCAPVQVADIGVMGCQVKDPSGAKGMVPGVNIFIGGTVGQNGHIKAGGLKGRHTSSFTSSISASLELLL